MINSSVNYKAWKFPAGEVGVKLEETYYPSARVLWKVEIGADWHSEFFEVAQLIEALKIAECQHIQLMIPYFPYARQDRACHEGEANALDIFSNFVMTLHYDTLWIFDMHSANNPLYNDSRTRNVFQHECVIARGPYDFIVAPDKGAVEKAKMVNYGFATGESEMIVMSKQRTANGITLEVEDKGALLQFAKSTGKPRVLVVDDICDGGATFLAVAKTLEEVRDHATFNVDLHITHGIFSKGLEELQNHYSQISCYNLMNPALKDAVPHVL